MAEIEIVSRIQKYLGIRTVYPNPNYIAAADFIIGQALFIFLETQCIELVEGKPIVLLKWSGSDPSLPAILLNSYFDLGPSEVDKWEHPPLGAVREKYDKIYARETQYIMSVGMQYLEAIRKLRSSGFEPLRSVYVTFVPGGFDGVAKLVESQIFKNLNIAIVLKQGSPSPTKSYRVFNGEKIWWSLQIKAVGQSGRGAKLYDNSAMENLTKSIESIMRFRASQFDLLKAGLKAEGHVISVNMVFLKAGTPTHDHGFVMNLQPSEAVAGFDIRVPPTADLEALERRLVEEWAPASRNMSFKLWRTDQDLAGNQLVTVTNASNPWLELLQNAVKQAGGMTSEPEIFPVSTDSQHFQKAGLPAIGFSPISNTPPLLHDYNEYLSQSEYLKGIDMYVSILKAYTSYASPE